MTDEIRQEDIHKSLFIQLVMMLATSASQQMGKLLDPVTKKATVNLDAAQTTIDLLDMIAAKTQGNLDPDESRLLNDTLMSLKLTFVETQESAGAAAKPETPPPSPPAGEPPGPKDDEPPPRSAPRFHKSY